MEKRVKGPIIGIDIDEVLAQYGSAFCNFHNKKYGTNFSFESTKEYALRKIVNTSEEEISHKIDEFHETEQFKKLSLVPGAKEAIADLAHAKFIAITARSEKIKTLTHNWLTRNFEGKITKVHFARNHVAQDKTVKTKAQFCREEGVHLMIEDSLENAKDCAQSGIPVFLLDRPWNQGEVPSRVTRVQSWAEIVQEITKVPTSISKVSQDFKRAHKLQFT